MNDNLEDKITYKDEIIKEINHFDKRIILDLALDIATYISGKSKSSYKPNISDYSFHIKNVVKILSVTKGDQIWYPDNHGMPLRGFKFFFPNINIQDYLDALVETDFIRIDVRKDTLEIEKVYKFNEAK